MIQLVLLCSCVLQGEEPFPENILTYVTRTSSLSYPPVSQVQSPEALPLRTLGRLQPDELSPQADSSADRLRPMAARVAYTAPRPPVLAGESDLGSRYILRNPSRAPRPSSVLVAPQKWLSPPGHPQDPLSTGDGESACHPGSYASGGLTSLVLVLLFSYLLGACPAWKEGVAGRPRCEGGTLGPPAIPYR